MNLVHMADKGGDLLVCRKETCWFVCRRLEGLYMRVYTNVDADVRSQGWLAGW